MTTYDESHALGLSTWFLPLHLSQEVRRPGMGAAGGAPRHGRRRWGALTSAALWTPSHILARRALPLIHPFGVRSFMTRQGPAPMLALVPTGVCFGAAAACSGSHGDGVNARVPTYACIKHPHSYQMGNPS
jgi:hypothetical protein